MSNEANPFEQDMAAALAAIDDSKDEVKRPIGYRATDEIRHELQVAGDMLGLPSLQMQIDVVVRMYLGKLSRETPGFAAAVEAARACRENLRSQKP